MENSRKIDKIQEVVNCYKKGIKETPACWGTLEEIEAMSFIIDEIEQIIILGDVSILNISFRDFLLSKGCCNSLPISKQIRDMFGSDDNDKLYNEYNKLRDEYYKWRDLKIGSLEIRKPEGAPHGVVP